MSASNHDPIPGDLVHVTPRGDMAGYIMCGATYVSGHQIPSYDEVVKPMGSSTLVHEVLFNGAIITVSDHSHQIQVLDLDE